MNKIFFGIHTSLLLLLCALLACCSQDEEEEKLATAVPLDISAVIDGMGTRANFNSDGSGEFDLGMDEITITIDGDKSGKSYIYLYNGNWTPKNDENRLLISQDDGELHLIAEYGTVDYSYLPLGLASLESNLKAECNVDFKNPKANFTFIHKACKLLLHANDCTLYDARYTTHTISVSDPEIIESGTAIEEGFINDTSSGYYIATIYFYPTATEITVVTEISTDRTTWTSYKSYKINLSGYKLEAGKIYTCYLKPTD
jgi:hypothetical protein